LIIRLVLINVIDFLTDGLRYIVLVLVLVWLIAMAASVGA
jgi:hypothetical protein